MNLLFMHQDMPGQFKHLAPALAAQGHRVAFLTKHRTADLPGVRRITYAPPRSVSPNTHHYVRSYEDAILHGQQVARACLRLRDQGFCPDVIIAHPGWGEPLFAKDVFPKACMLSYCEFYYHGHGADLGFDPEFPLRLDAICQAHARNAHLLLALVACDHGISPTWWQRSLHPPDLQAKISVVFDGIDTDLIRPARNAQFHLPSGIVLTRSNQVVTYTTRNLEPYRGFHCFMRALPAILDGCPSAQIVIVGGDDVSYGNAPSDGRTWREVMVQEVGCLDPGRVHFLNMLAYGDYLRLLQVSQVHVYLTIPFVVSWSCMEALAAGCLVVGSQTPPVQEVIQDGENGLLVDFFSPAKIGSKVIEALRGGDGFDHIRRRARLSVMERYSLSECLTKQIDLVRSLV